MFYGRSDTSPFVLLEDFLISGSKSGTGTVIIQVEDVNDNVPEVPNNILFLCDTEESGSVVVVAEDIDQPPFSSPFTFSLPDDNDGKWSVTRLNGGCRPIKYLTRAYECVQYVDMFSHSNSLAHLSFET